VPVLLPFFILFAASAPRISSSAQILTQHCKKYAAQSKNPWALAHGIKLFGLGFRADDGRKAAEVITHDFLQKGSTPAELFFVATAAAADGTPVEPHSNLNTKALVCEGHLKLNAKLPATWGPVTAGELVESIKHRFRHQPQSAAYWKDIGWTLDLLAHTQKTTAQLNDVQGNTISIDTVFEDALNELERSTAELKQGLVQHLAQVDKRKQGLYAHSCGGFHFVQGVLSWARNPDVKKRWQKRLDEQIAIHFYRLDSEQRQYEAAFAQASVLAPQLVNKVLVQMLKFHGHFLETAARFRSDFQWKPAAEQTKAIEFSKAKLDWTVKELESRNVLASMQTIQQSDFQMYLDLIGDSCHAAHGLQDWP
jgi:hypothetical protein